MVTTNQAWHEARRRQLAEERFGGVCECGNHAWARLTRGYVVLVDAGDAGILQTHPRNAKIRQCEVYASRGENTLHRELLGTDACVYQKLKLGRSGDEVRLGWQVT